MAKSLSAAEVNHLRRLVAWVECEVGPTPEDLIKTAQHISPAVGDVSDDAKQRLQASLEHATKVPQYVRQALKALRKVVASAPGEVVDAELTEASGLPGPRLGEK